MPTYQLGGADAGSFEIGLGTGQITVKANAELDHEDKPTHTVTVTATDSHNASVTITVTIHVTDVDEAPAAMEYIKTVEYPENGTGPVLTLTAVDPEDASPIIWSPLASNDSGDQDIPGEGGNDGAEVADDVMADDVEDGDLFKISADGVLEFKAKPDFENPADADVADNVYKVVVQASRRHDDELVQSYRHSHGRGRGRVGEAEADSPRKHNPVAASGWGRDNRR